SVVNDEMLWSALIATDVLGLAAGAWLLFRPRARGVSWASDLRRLTWFGLALLALTFLAGSLASGGVMNGGFLILRLWCHALFCVFVPLAMARGVQRRGRIGLLVIVAGFAAEGAYVWAREVEPFRLE